MKHNILLADDDEDDRLLFQEVLEELSIEVSLSTVNDGVQLMQFLSSTSNNLPNALFLDLNMPRKSGIECLSEIKMIDGLKHIPIVIYSTSLNMEVVDLLYEKGANYYIRKPGEFSSLKNVISKAISLTSSDNFQQPKRVEFILQP
ncbi:response regulator [Sediminicola sp. 1XM1-17]|uniref:response regulator n=1 Tax=Sediminicola sp. 1XM1-17 TaxID=3127702 RepID=UPI003078A4EA